MQYPSFIHTLLLLLLLFTSFFRDCHRYLNISHYSINKSSNPLDNLQSTPKGGITTAETGQAPFLEPNTSYSDSSANSITQQMYHND